MRIVHTLQNQHKHPLKNQLPYRWPTMETRRAPPEYALSLFADPTTITPLIKGILHTIFFHRYFPTIRPSTHEILSLTLPYVDDPDLASLIDSRAAHLTRQLSSTNSPNSSVRGNIGVQFFEKRRRKSAAGFGGVGGVGMAWFGVRGNNGGNAAEEEVCWEVWRLEVTLAMPRTQEGQFALFEIRGWDSLLDS